MTDRLRTTCCALASPSPSDDNFRHCRCATSCHVIKAIHRRSGPSPSVPCRLHLASSSLSRRRPGEVVNSLFQCVFIAIVARFVVMRIFHSSKKSSHTESSHRVIPSIHRQIQASNLDSCSRTSTVSLGSSSFLSSSFHPAKSCLSSFVDRRFEFAHFSGLGLHPSHLVKLASSRTCSMDPRLSRALRPSVVGKYAIVASASAILDSSSTVIACQGIVASSPSRLA